ncbi:bifunctional AP-4-A phosphorylase/ADP sulfurylase [Rhizoclosmatium sp. JEL0117]|nr:bifunctional AP-4-A phosphorylase/ADP sulfurylase [Rhizoclosmatium sp. JEL0117]
MASSLASRLSTQFDKALSTGHLVFTPSTTVIIPSGKINFQIRLAPSLAKKPTGGLTQEKKEPKKPFNPFLVPEPDLLVDSTLLPLHNILLNKFSVVKGHVIITTKAWESQSSLLNANDFSAAWTLLETGEYLGFYNCGPLSGASVPHKHMQFIPVVKGSTEEGIPIESVMEGWAKESKPLEATVVPRLPYLHRACFFPPAEKGRVDAKDVERVYVEMVHDAFKAVGIDLSETLNHAVSTGVEGEGKEEVSYNVIFTREWMVVVPRRAETYKDLSVNSVGFAGMMLAKSDAQLGYLKQSGALVDVMAGVTFSTCQ